MQARTSHTYINTNLCILKEAYVSTYLAAGCYVILIWWSIWFDWRCVFIIFWASRFSSCALLTLASPRDELHTIHIKVIGFTIHKHNHIASFKQVFNYMRDRVSIVAHIAWQTSGKEGDQHQQNHGKRHSLRWSKWINWRLVVARSLIARFELDPIRRRRVCILITRVSDDYAVRCSFNQRTTRDYDFYFTAWWTGFGMMMRIMCAATQLF